ncbi:hypothetical protein CR513_21596, partial [Mucuna pruriens]
MALNAIYVCEIKLGLNRIIGVTLEVEDLDSMQKILGSSLGVIIQMFLWGSIFFHICKVKTDNFVDFKVEQGDHQCQNGTTSPQYSIDKQVHRNNDPFRFFYTRRKVRKACV